MTGLDTNVIVRYIVQDDPAQFAISMKLFGSFTPESPGFISAVSVLELVWVLQSCYKARRDEVERVLETLLRTRALIVERAELIWQSLRVYAKSNADFEDCLIERTCHAIGCDQTMTFDRDAAKSAGMKLLS